MESSNIYAIMISLFLYIFDQNISLFNILYFEGILWNQVIFMQL